MALPILFSSIVWKFAKDFVSLQREAYQRL